MLFLSLEHQSAVNRGLSVNWTGTFGHWQRVQTQIPGQMPQNAVFDQGLHCLLELQEVKCCIQQSCRSSGPFSKPTFRDSQPTSAVSALISLSEDPE